MKIRLGMDVGATGAKAALVLPTAEARRLVEARSRAGGSDALRMLQAGDGAQEAVLVLAYRRTRGRPLEAVRELLTVVHRELGDQPVSSFSLTGSGSRLVADLLGVGRCNEFQAAARAIGLLHPNVRSVFELGGETSKYLRLEPDAGSGRLGIVDYGTNGDCAAGTGAFLDQQAARLKYRVEEIGQIAEQAERAAQIAGRCSVFAKSDMIHAQQKGYTPPEVLRGLCAAVAANFKAAVVKGRTPKPPIAVIGGVAANRAVIRGLAEAFGLADGQLLVPPGADAMAAVGAAMLGAEAAASSCPSLADCLARLETASEGGAYAFPTSPPLAMDHVTLLRERTRTRDFGGGKADTTAKADWGAAASSPSCAAASTRTDARIAATRDGGPTKTRSTRAHAIDVGAARDVGSHGDAECVRNLGGNGDTVDAYLGLDIGSVGTKLVVIDRDGRVIHDIFTRTEGRPVEVVGRCLRELREAVGARIRICGVGSTGSGRELIGELVGADSINDEITAHKTGATFVADRLLGGKRPDTIFEIGGQDSKYISLQQEGGDSGDTVVVDFTMNEACAAGTGSFLEERAEELGVAIKGEFSELALRSKAPIKLGERCTVFMERDVNTYMQRGAKREDVIAGLAYSVVYNYINRVVRGRPVGDCVFFQGGTAYNDAVAAAFAAVTGKRIIVPPHNAVLGAIGAALLAMEKMATTGRPTRFRGYELDAVDYTLREFTCKGCGNQCAVQEFNVEGEKTFWGDKCSDRYRKRAKTDRKPTIPDLVALRHELLQADDEGDPPDARVRIGVPMAMYAHDWLPLWRRFFRDCGMGVVCSAETNRRTVQKGLDSIVAEPCFPIIVAHGHVADLVDRGVDFLWLPNIVSSQTQFMENESYVCPWGQTLPFVIRQSPAFRAWQGRILCPTLRMREGMAHVRDVLVRLVRDLGVRRARAEQAFDAGRAALQRFQSAYENAGRQALATLERTGESGMVLVGRPYNIHDAGVSLSVARKLRDYYGVNVLPIDALPLADVDVRDVNDNMYWEYGRRILAAAKLVRQQPNLHIIYITNFKCGPDSFIKGYIRPASGKPFLTLQFDGHSNDAGMMTRCEAYLDSKGILRWWRRTESEPAERASKAERFTSRPCPTPAPG